MLTGDSMPTATIDEVAEATVPVLDAALFPGSYSQWSSDPTRVVETG